MILESCGYHVSSVSPLDTQIFPLLEGKGLSLRSDQKSVQTVQWFSNSNSKNLCEK